MAMVLSHRKGRRFSPGRLVAWAYVTVILFLTIFPFYWILRTSLSNNYALSTDPSSPLPVGFGFGAFKRALGAWRRRPNRSGGGSGAALDTGLFLRNSIIYAAI
ncbi:ABC transporter permease family protein [Fodinicola feengrottensis]|uniref:hypothetical protein n=1 Tax=Fodinicola feengrottensis TaxID=435914 RepID=UPI002441EE63|nr:hypothetical protein [Fodinicola feengrottensis]